MFTSSFPIVYRSFEQLASPKSAKIQSSEHTWAQGGELSRISPPEKFWVEIPPHREGYSLAKYSPPSEKFFPHPKNSPPKI